MKNNIILNIIALLLVSATFINASRSDFYGKNDDRPELFKILDDHIGTIQINLPSEIWEEMKKSMYAERGMKLPDKYGTNNATMEFFVKGTDYSAKLDKGEFTFRTGGAGSRNDIKPGYNIKLEKGNIFGVKLLRIRAVVGDISFMTEKISSDILNKMGVPSTSTGYINMKVNDEDLGLFIVTNKIKKDFIEKYFGEKDTTSLYECKDNYIRFEKNGIGKKCTNLKDELVDDREDLMAFNEAVLNANSVEELEKIFDIDLLLKNIAFEFLTDSWDNFVVFNHNYLWYKNQENKWVLLLNDFDNAFGKSFHKGLVQVSTYGDKSYYPEDNYINLFNLSIYDLDNGHKFLKYLIHKDDTRWRKIVAEAVKNAFNPKLLIPRIDEIAELIRDDVAESRLKNDEKTGKCKGCYNINGSNPNWTMEEFDDVTNYVGWEDCYPLKLFIEERFKYVCHTYGIDPETLELIEPRPKVSYWGIKNKYEYVKEKVGDHRRFTFPNLDKEDYKQEEYNAHPELHEKPTDYEVAPNYYDDNYDSSKDKSCWSRKFGYECCDTCRVYEIDENGEWGYEDGEWCGAKDFCKILEHMCWSSKYGYDCCTSCDVVLEDETGKWGYENDAWCGIQASCDGTIPNDDFFF